MLWTALYHFKIFSHVITIFTISALSLKLGLHASTLVSERVKFSGAGLIRRKEKLQLRAPCTIRCKSSDKAAGAPFTGQSCGQTPMEKRTSSKGHSMNEHIFSFFFFFFLLSFPLPLRERRFKVDVTTLPAIKRNLGKRQSAREHELHRKSKSGSRFLNRST